MSDDRQARIKTLEHDLEHALASVGAFRQAIEDVWTRAAGESGEDGFVVSYVIPVGTLHRAIGLARGTDAGGKLLADLAAARAEAEALREALNELTDASEVLGEMVAADPDAMRRTGQPNLGITSRLVVATMDARAILAQRPERRDGGGAG